MMVMMMMMVVVTGFDLCAKHHACSKDATCASSKVSYVCQCNDGFSGDGVTCSGQLMMIMMVVVVVVVVVLVVFCRLHS